MRILLLTTVGVAAVLTTVSPAIAQTTASTLAGEAPTVVVEGQGPAPRGYRMGEAQDSGVSTFKRDSV